MSVHEILNAITEAKTALDREPVLQSRITELEHNLDKSQRHAQELELKLMERNATIDALQSKCRSLEVERDDMGFRELEAQDKLDALRNVVKTFTAAAESLMPKVVEVAQAEPVSESVTIGSAATGSFSTAPLNESEPMPPPNPALSSEAGQSASPLPSPVTSGEPKSEPSSVNYSAPTDATSTKPYEGKTYSQVFGSTANTGVSLTEWEQGGGSTNNYWR
jgi:hypothetical protein